MGLNILQYFYTQSFPMAYHLLDNLKTTPTIDHASDFNTITATYVQAIDVMLINQATK